MYPLTERWRAAAVFRRLSLGFVLCGVVTCIGCAETETPFQPNAKSPALAEGEAIVKANCRSCHLPGINGAPILGNTKMWGPRVTQGKAVLVQHAAEGYGLMPAKGGNDQLTKPEIELAVSYMLSLLE